MRFFMIVSRETINYLGRELIRIECVFRNIIQGIKNTFHANVSRETPHT